MTKKCINKYAVMYTRTKDTAPEPRWYNAYYTSLDLAKARDTVDGDHDYDDDEPEIAILNTQEDATLLANYFQTTADRFKYAYRYSVFRANFREIVA